MVRDRAKRLTELRQYTSDSEILDSIDHVAFNQEELAYLLDENVHDIYLCNNKFSIPTNITNKKYIGIGRVVAIIHSKWKVDFWLKRIEFVNISFDAEYSAIDNPTPEKLYQMGFELKQKHDYYEARDYYVRAIKAGNSDAIFELADEYRGSGRIGGDVFNESIWCENLDSYWIEYYKNAAQEKQKLSYESLLKAAELGNSSAMLELSNKCLYKKDYHNCDEWKKKAAETGDRRAILAIAESCCLGKCAYIDEGGYIKDEEEALRLSKKVADLGWHSALKTLTEIHERKNDYSFHHQWFEKMLLSEKVDAWEIETFFIVIKRNNYNLPEIEHKKFVDGVLNLCNRLLCTCMSEMTLRLAAEICSKLNCFDEAIALIGKAFDVIEGWSTELRYVYECLGDVYKDRGMYKEAIKAYEDGIALFLACELPPYDTWENGNVTPMVEKIKLCKGKICDI